MGTRLFHRNRGGKLRSCADAGGREGAGALHAPRPKHRPSIGGPHRGGVRSAGRICLRAHSLWGSPLVPNHGAFNACAGSAALHTNISRVGLDSLTRPELLAGSPIPASQGEKTLYSAPK